MNIRKVLGGVFIMFSMLLSIGNIVSSKVTGAAIGSNLESSVFALLTFMFFVMGLIFMSNLERRTSNWVKAAVIAGSIAVAGTPGYISRNESGENRIEKLAKEKNRIENFVEIDDNVKLVHPYETTQGKFERTYRWDRIIDGIEEKYEIPRGKLKALIMRESGGDPLNLNDSNDGGAGLAMFQPGTARDMGLKVYGNSNTSGVDKKHGEEMRRLVKEHNYNYEELSQIDERFDIEKSAEAAAKYLKKNYLKYGSWDKALSAYNQGRPAPNASETKHVKAVNKYEKYYNERDTKDKEYYTKLDSIKRLKAEQDLKVIKRVNKFGKRRK